MRTLTLTGILCLCLSFAFAQKNLLNLTEAEKSEFYRKQDAAIKADSILRDSLIKVAHEWAVPFNINNNDRPSASWLRGAISRRKDQLSKGEMYNSASSKNIIDVVQDKLEIDKNNPMLGELVVKISESGKLSASTRGLSTINQQIIDSINKMLSEITIAPYQFNGHFYPSYKVFYMKSLPPLKVEISEKGK